jgi:hypothetical protein
LALELVTKSNGGTKTEATSDPGATSATTKRVSSEEWACQLCHSKIWRIKSDKDKDKRGIDFQHWDYRFRKICDGSLKRNGNNDLHFSTNAVQPGSRVERDRYRSDMRHARYWTSPEDKLKQDDQLGCVTCETGPIK